MCWRWAAGRVTPLGVAWALAASSGFLAQAARQAIATATAPAPLRPVRTRAARGMEGGSARIGGPGQIGPVPPAPAQRLDQGGGVGVAVGLGLHERDARLLVGRRGGRRRRGGGGA